MKTKDFNEYLKKRLSPKEIDEIQRSVDLEIKKGSVVAIWNKEINDKFIDLINHIGGNKAWIRQQLKLPEPIMRGTCFKDGIRTFTFKYDKKKIILNFTCNGCKSEIKERDSNAKKLLSMITGYSNPSPTKDE
jgi:hypothetical protein